MIDRRRLLSLGAGVAVGGVTPLGGFAAKADSPTLQQCWAMVRDSVSVTRFGAVGDGFTDDTAAIQAALAAADTVTLPAGKTYCCSTIAVPSNKTIMGYGATLKLLAFNGAATDHNSVLELNKATNVRIFGLTIDGSRYDHSNTARITKSEDGGMHGIRILAATDVWIVDVTCRDCYSDGIIIMDDVYHRGDGNLDQPARIHCERCVFDGNRRQGCSLISGTDLHFTDCQFINTIGTPPEYGVDIEPDPGQTHQAVRRVSFTRCQFTGNNGRGFGTLIPGQTIEDIVLRDCHIADNGAAEAVWPMVKNGGTCRRLAVIGGYVDRDIRIGESTGKPMNRTAIYQDCLIENVSLGPDARVNVVNTRGAGWNVVIRGVLAPANATAEIIRMVYAEGILIDGCDLEGGTRAIRAIAGTDRVKRVIIRGNAVRGSAVHNISIDAAEDIDITNNTISDAKLHGLYLGSGLRAAVTNNMITNNGGRGLFIDAGWNTATIGANTIENNRVNQVVSGSNVVTLNDPGD